MMRKMLAAAALASMAFAASAVDAALLDGATVQIRYLYPDQTHDDFDPVTAVVGSGEEASYVWFGTYPVLHVDLADAQILLTMTDVSPLSPESRYFTGPEHSDGAVTFNGLSFFDVFFELSDIEFSVDPASTLVGVLSPGEHTLFVNLMGLTFDEGSFMLIHATRSEVPEPATLAVLGLGLAGLGLVRRRKAA